MHERGDVQIMPVRSGGDVLAVGGLFRDYAASLNIDLSFQGFAAELAGLPGSYAEPGGVLLLARAKDGRAVGCVALRALAAAPGCCEMKRLYVAPEGRGAGLGARLVRAIILAGEQRGYDEMWLDTLPSMTGALALYAKFGFAPMPAYYDTPIPGTVFLRRVLR